MLPADVILKRFESPDEVRDMVKGRFELVRIGGMTIGRATYEPGWRWSEHVGPAVGATRCTVEHVGLVLSGTATAAGLPRSRERRIPGIALKSRRSGQASGQRAQLRNPASFQCVNTTLDSRVRRSDGEPGKTIYQMVDNQGRRPNIQPHGKRFVSATGRGVRGPRRPDAASDAAQPGPGATNRR